MPRGGRRAGRAGEAYAQRSDLNQPVRTVPGQAYGAQTAQADAQRVVPLPSSAAPHPAPMARAAPAIPPEGLLSAPTTRPGEPVTAGLPIGAGPGPEALGIDATGNDQVLANLYAAYRLNPSPGLLAIITQTEQTR